METKDLLKKLEEDLVEMDRKNSELTGDYILVVERQNGVHISMERNVELLANGIGRMFEILNQLNKEASKKLLAMLCMQTLAEHFQEKGE